MFRRRVTIQYPDEKPVIPPRWRGRIILSRDPDGEERCVACYLCAAACPVDCIALQATEDEYGRRYPSFFRINFSRCIFCGYCEEACPTDAIQLTPDFEMGEYDRKNLVYEKEDLLIDGTGKYPDYNFYRVAGLAIRGQGQGRGRERSAARGSASPVALNSEPELKKYGGAMEFTFYLSGAIAIAATLMVITGLSAVHALLYLIVSLLAVAIVFYVLGAPFAAALEVIIYAGAIMVLFVFVMMMLNLGKAAAAQGAGLAEPRHVGGARRPGRAAAGRTGLYPRARRYACSPALPRWTAKEVGIVALRTLSSWCRAGFAAAAGRIGRRVSPGPARGCPSGCG